MIGKLAMVCNTMHIHFPASHHRYLHARSQWWCGSRPSCSLGSVGNRRAVSAQELWNLNGHPRDTTLLFLAMSLSAWLQAWNKQAIAH